MGRDPNNPDIMSATVTIPTDAVTGAMLGVDTPHSKIHSGTMYSVSISKSAMGVGATLRLKFTAPPVKKAHLQILATTSGQALFEFHENPTMHAPPGGGAETARNRERSIADLSTMAAILSDPAVDVEGTILESQIIGSGKNAGGTPRGDGEWILLPTEDYDVLITSQSAANICTITINWYEETP